MNPHAVVFDAYGTLFDVLSIVARADVKIPGDLHTLSTLWRQKQLEYTWLRPLMECYEDFWGVTEAALRAALTQLKIQVSEPHLHALMQAYLSPPAFPDARPALEALRESQRASLSNGSPTMLASAVRRNGMESCFVEVISVDKVRTYKPSPRVYALSRP